MCGIVGAVPSYPDAHIWADGKAERVAVLLASTFPVLFPVWNTILQDGAIHSQGVSPHSVKPLWKPPQMHAQYVSWVILKTKSVSNLRCFVLFEWYCLWFYDILHSFMPYLWAWISLSSLAVGTQPSVPLVEKTISAPVIPFTSLPKFYWASYFFSKQRQSIVSHWFPWWLTLAIQWDRESIQRHLQGGFVLLS